MAKAKTKKPKLKYPKEEVICTTCCERGGNPLFLITTNPLTEYFFIYEFTSEGLIKLGRGKSPIELEDKFNVRKRMGVD